MITTAQEYFNTLWRIQSDNAPSLAVLLPSDEKIYNVDLNSRMIEAPEFLGLTEDHEAETIYFKVNRFFDNQDLSQMICVIQFTNGTDKGAYVVPFFDLSTYGQEDKMLFPWCIDKTVTKKSGDIEFSIRFYRVDTVNKNFTYNLNTLPAKSKVLKGLDGHFYEEDTDGNILVSSTEMENIYTRLQAVEKEDIFWDSLY